jgi:hypothetical protein
MLIALEIKEKLLKGEIKPEKNKSKTFATPPTSLAMSVKL